MLNNYKMVWGLTLVYALLIGCKKDEAAAQSPVTIKSPLTQKILDSSGVIAQVFSDTLFDVSPGIKETDIHYLSREGYSMRVFILEVDASHPDILLQAGTPYNAAAYAMQTVPDMAKYMEKPDYRVMAAVNADFFNTTTGEPRGIYVKDGAVLKTTWANARSATFLGVLKNGKPYIGDRDDFLAVKDDLEDALGGGPMLVRNNQVLAQTDLSVEPRTGIGMNEQGKMYFMVVDGRSFYYSNGLTITQLGHMLKACGSTIAINVDGGGSSTFMIKHPLANVWQVRNRPSDGNNRAVGNAWMIISR